MELFTFSELRDAPLIVDAIYEGGSERGIATEPLHILLPRTSNQGGFRITHRADDMSKPAYVVIFTSMEEQEWPDYLDVENGIFRYYGDNRHPGKELHDTRKKGNILLRDVFGWLDSGDERFQVPPFLIFHKTGRGRDVRFLGLAAPGSNHISYGKDLVALWRTMNGQRFQNYESYFTVLDTGNESISKDWLRAVVYDFGNSLKLAPSCWKEYIDLGKNGIRALRAPKVLSIPSKASQLPVDDDGRIVLEKIRNYYSSEPYRFEKCATYIVQMMDSNFYDFDLTRPWRDGGRDAIGKYHIGMPSHPLSIDCALEAKCYGENNSVGTRQMSRLISRIKYRQFGVLVTTSYIDKQAYSEVIEDGHPILVLSAMDIAEILRRNGIVSDTVDAWMDALEQ